jgi:hypothetical protein
MNIVDQVPCPIKERKISVKITEQDYFWMQKILELEKVQKEFPELENISQVVRFAIFLLNKSRFGDRYKLSPTDFKEHNSKSGRIYKNERW